MKPGKVESYACIDALLTSQSCRTSSRRECLCRTALWESRVHIMMHLVKWYFSVTFTAFSVATSKWPQRKRKKIVKIFHIFQKYCCFLSVCQTLAPRRPFLAPSGRSRGEDGGLDASSTWRLVTQRGRTPSVVFSDLDDFYRGKTIDQRRGPIPPVPARCHVSALEEENMWEVTLVVVTSPKAASKRCR